jgi:hypothetical protein
MDEMTQPQAAAAYDPPASPPIKRVTVGYDGGSAVILSGGDDGAGGVTVTEQNTRIVLTADEHPNSRVLGISGVVVSTTPITCPPNPNTPLPPDFQTQPALYQPMPAVTIVDQDRTSATYHYAVALTIQGGTVLWSDPQIVNKTR